MGEPKIYYAVVANWGGEKGSPQFLTEASSCTVMNVANISKTIIGGIAGHNHKASYTYDKYLFHYIVDERICYLCMADEAFETRVPFDFLDRSMAAFKNVCRDRWSTITQAKEVRDFTSELNRLLASANSGEDDQIRKTKRAIEDSTEIMTKNIDTLLQRGEKIDILVERSHDLDQGATAFKSNAKHLHWSMWKRKCQMTVCLIFIVLLVIFIIVLIACGGFKFKKCK